jgi:hypothetical protein
MTVTPRRIVQIAIRPNGPVYAVADDGTVWADNPGGKPAWIRLPALPPVDSRSEEPQEKTP